jgi:hypothetical protein
MPTGFWWGNLKEEDLLEDLCVDGRIILKLVFEKWDGDMDRTNLAPDWDMSMGCCECGNEPSGFIKCGEISSVAEELLASQVGLSFMGSVS